MTDKDDKAFPVISLKTGKKSPGKMSVPSVKPDDPVAGAPATPTTPATPAAPTQLQAIKIDSLAPQPGSGVISTGGITFTVIPSPQPHQGQRFVIPKVSPQQQFTGINPLTIKHVGSNPTINTAGNITMKSLNQNAMANPLQGVSMNLKPTNPGTTNVSVANLSVNQASFPGKTSVVQTPGAMTVTGIPNLQLAALQQQPGLQQTSTGAIQQIQLPANLQAQAGQLGQFILIKTEPQGQPTIGVLQKGALTPQQLQGAQIIGQAPLRLEPKLATGKAAGKGKTDGVHTLHSTQQVALAAVAAHPGLVKDKLGKKSKGNIKQIQIQPAAAMVRAPLPSPTTQIQQIQARFQGFQTTSPAPQQPDGKGTNQLQVTQQQQQTLPSPTAAVGGTSPQQGQIRPIQLPKVIFKHHQQQQQGSGIKSPATTLIASPTFQAIPVPTTPTTNVVTTTAAGTTFAQPIIVTQGGVQQRFILQTAPNQVGTIRMPSSTQPGNVPSSPLVPVVSQVTAKGTQKLQFTTKGVVPPVSMTTATVAQQLAQTTRFRFGVPSGGQIRPSTTQPQGPGIVTSPAPGPQGMNISQQQLLQAGIRQPLPPGTQLHITSTSKGFQLQPVQTVTTATPSGLVSSSMTVAQTLQLQAQAKLTPRIPSTTISNQQSLQGKITTLGQLGALSNAHLLPTNNIQVQGAPQTSTIPAGQVSSQTTGLAQQSVPIQATIIPSSLMSSQAGTVSAGQIVVQQQALNAAIAQSKGTVVGGSSGVQQQHPMQARLVYQHADGSQTNMTTSSGNIAIQAIPTQESPQRSIQQVSTGNIPGSPSITVAGQQQVAQPGQPLQTVIQPQLIQTCGAQATIGLIQVSVSQSHQPQSTTVNTLNTPMVRATLQSPSPQATIQQQTTVPQQSTPVVTGQTQQPLQLQLSGLPGQSGQVIQVVAAQAPSMMSPPLASPQNIAVSVASAAAAAPVENQVVFPKLDDIEIEETEPVSTIDLAIRYNMSYPQAPIPRRKRRHSETEEKTDKPDDPKPTDKSSDGSTDKPSTSTDKPSTSTDKPSTSTDIPSTSTDKPSTSTSTEDKGETSKEGTKDEGKKEEPMDGVKEIGDSDDKKKKTEESKKEPEAKKDDKPVKTVAKTDVVNKDQKTIAPREQSGREGRSEEETVEFTWDEYLELTGATPVPHDAFRHVELGIKSVIKVGMKVEAPNQPSIYNPSSKSYWVATVVATSGTLLLLRYEGYGDVRQADFWCELTKADLHPIGWCARSGHILQPPDALMGNNVNWQEFLVNTLTGSKTIPETYLVGKIKPIPVDRIRRGMRLELTDATNPKFTWIAIIKENHGGRLRLRYAGIDDEKEDIWLHYLHWRVHYIGWAKINDATIAPPRCLRHRNPTASDAHWNTAYQYALTAAYKDPIPKDLFKDQPKIKGYQFKVGMKLEAINPRSPSQIAPATITKVFKDKYFVATIDDCTSEKSGGISVLCHGDSGGIFPVKWCKRHGFSITPPKGYQGVKFDWNSYLRQHGVKGAPSDCFRSARDGDHHPFQPGFKLEAVNPYHPAQISVATITKVAGRHVWLHFDGSKLPNHIVDTKGFDIFPVGWCDTNGYPLRAPKKLLAKRRKIAIVWPEKHHHSRLMPMSPGRDLYQKIRGGTKPEDAAGDGWLGKLYFNHKCFSGPFLNKGRIAELPKAVGPGIVTLVIREVISLLVNAGYKPPRVLRELQVENEETAGMNGYLQIMKAKYKGKSFRALVEICKTTTEVNEYLRNMCIKLECCPNLISQQYIEEDCPLKCAMLTKTKYNYLYGKKKVPKPSLPSTSPTENGESPNKKHGRKRKKRRPFVHRKKHNLVNGSGEGGEGEEGEPEEKGAGEAMETVEGESAITHVKHEKPAVTRARALVESAKRTKKIHHHTPPKLILPARERGTKMKTFAARLTSSRAQRKAEKLEEEQAKKESLITAKAEKEKKKKKSKEIERLHLDSNPLNWTVEEVVQFIIKTDCVTLANIFKEQEIDGQALLLLTLPTVQECMDLKLGPAIKLCHHIERVKIAFYEQFAK